MIAQLLEDGAALIRLDQDGSLTSRPRGWYQVAPVAVVLIPSWEQPVVGNLSDKLGAFWELVIGSDASARSLGIGWEPGSQKSTLGALKLPKAVVACTP